MYQLPNVDRAKVFSSKFCNINALILFHDSGIFWGKINFFIATIAAKCIVTYWCGNVLAHSSFKQYRTTSLAIFTWRSVVKFNFTTYFFSTVVDPDPDPAGSPFPFSFGCLGSGSILVMRIRIKEHGKLPKFKNKPGFLTFKKAFVSS
jgi:hypothetical protein